VARRFPALLMVLALGACIGQPSPTPTFPAIRRILATPYLEPLVAGWMMQYTAQHGPAPFDLETLPHPAGLERAGESGADILVTAQEPPESWFATPLSSQPLAIIVNAENPVQSLTVEELGGLFSGRIGRWEEVGGSTDNVQPVIPLPGDDFRSRFEALVLRDIPAASSSLHAPHPEAMILAVAQDEAAIGYVPLSLVTSEVRILRIDGILPGGTTLEDGRYTLVVQVTAMAPQEPRGAVRDWLAWLQAGQIGAP